MHTFVGTLRDYGTRYADNIGNLQALANSAFPKPMAYLTTGVSTNNLKILKSTHTNTSPVPGEWYIPRAVVPEETFGGLNKFNFKPEVLRQGGRNEIILYLHGGAFALCTYKTHRSLVLKLSQTTNLPVLAIDYRKPPDHPFPAPRDDAFKAYEMLVNQGFSVTIAGDSAGGNLALMVTKKAKEGNLALPKSLVLISPWVNLVENHTNSGDQSSIKRNSSVDFLPLLGIKTFAEAALGQGSKEFSSLKSLSPEFFDFTGYPPILILSGEYEMLRDQQDRFVNKLMRADVSYEHIIAPGMVHVYPLFAFLKVGQAKEAFRQIARFLANLRQ
jgi:acetyl esterase/lipase